LQSAKTELDAGHPAAALDFIERALPLAPDDPHLLRMQERARQQLAKQQTVAQQQSQLTALVQAGEAALQNGNAQQALDLGRQVLALVPNEPRATALVTQA